MYKIHFVSFHNTYFESMMFYAVMIFIMFWTL